ncbi:hypothetical protein HGA91_05610 [candidate division WWE3 bacterium]|nr:hypothetical protein [candidate division WWE3 bacterium]
MSDLVSDDSLLLSIESELLDQSRAGNTANAVLFLCTEELIVSVLAYRIVITSSTPEPTLIASTITLDIYEEAAELVIQYQDADKPAMMSVCEIVDPNDVLGWILTILKRCGIASFKIEELEDLPQDMPDRLKEPLGYM